MKNKDILLRINELIKIFGGNQSKFAKEIGVSQPNLSKILKGERVAGDAVLNKIIISLDINKDWLLEGKGTMLRDRTNIENTDNNDAHAHMTRTYNPNEGIPLIPLSAMAGALTSEQQVLEYECERYVVPMFDGADYLIQVKGSSMQPKYYAGDIVACKRVPMDRLFFQWGKVYVIDTDQGVLIKRIKPGTDKEHVLIVSDNDNYAPFELPVASIYNVSLVVGVIRLE